MTDIFTMNSSGLPRGTRVVGFRGTEGISRLFAFEVYLALDPDGAESFDLGAAVDATASLVLDRQDGRPPFAFHGVFSEAALVHHQKDGRALCRAVLVPRLWQLTQTLHSRIFTAMSIPDIIKKVLEDAGLSSSDYALQLSQSYATEEHVCQYAESDFDFISRWMEREGMYYFFEHGDDAATLVIADDKAAHENLVEGAVRFSALAGADSTAPEGLHTFICRRRSLPASIRLKDYDYAKPSLDVSGKASVSKNGAGEISRHGARFFTPDAGKRLAALRAEEMLSREIVFTGTGTCFYLRAGYSFTLADHPRVSFDAEYLATEVEHVGNQSASTAELMRLTGLDGDETYRVAVTAIPRAVQFRAEARTEWPRIYGNEHGLVDGEADSEYAQIDDHGRYTVRFAFDESDLGPGKASTRVRMMQPHGGATEGWHFPLRKGTEILFTFLGGDPDRPVIAGVVPNAQKPSPVTKSNHTKNVIQTGGRNRFELEDKEGEERITLSTPHSNSYIRMGAPNHEHHMIVRTDGSTLLETGGDWDVNVGKKLTEVVHGDVKETYQGQRTTDISKGRFETIWSAGMNQAITGGWVQWVKGDSSQTIIGGYKHKVSGEQNENYGSQRTKCGDGSFEYASVHASVTGTVMGEAADVIVTSPKVAVNASTHFNVFSPSINLKTGTSIKSYTPLSIESFGSKNAVGGAKADITIDVSLGVTNLKLEACATKVENGGAKKATFGGVYDTVATSVKQFVTSSQSAGISTSNAGLTKIG